MYPSLNIDDNNYDINILEDMAVLRPIFGINVAIKIIYSALSLHKTI